MASREGHGLRRKLLEIDEVADQADEPQQNPGGERARCSDHDRHRRQLQKAAVRGEIAQGVPEDGRGFG